MGAACDAERPPAPAANESSAPTPRPVHAPAPGLPYEGDWTLVSGADQDGPIPLDDDFPITLELSARHANGKSTCNGYGGPFKIDGTAYHPGRFGADDAGCVSEALELTETRYILALMTAAEISADEATLRLTGPETELVFERVPEIDLDAIVDRTWASGNHTLLLSSDRTFRVTYGCEVLKGTWKAMVGRIYMPEARRTNDCTNDGADDIPLDVTSGDFSVSVDGNRLTITYGGTSVVYRAERR